MGCMQSSLGKVGWCNFQSFIYNHAHLIGSQPTAALGSPQAIALWEGNWPSKMVSQFRIELIKSTGTVEVKVPSAWQDCWKSTNPSLYVASRKGSWEETSSVEGLWGRLLSPMDRWGWNGTLCLLPAKVWLDSKRFRMMYCSQWKEKNGLNEIQPNSGSKCRAIKGWEEDNFHIWMDL